jgi:hypothetical protein
MSNFPTSIDSLTDPTATSKLNSPSHSQQHINVNDAIEKIEAKVGVNNSAVTSSHDYKLSGVTGTDKASSVAGEETLLNKTHTLPKINEDVELTAKSTELNLLDGITDIDPDETMAADSDTVIPTQKAVKAAILAKVINRAFSWFLGGTETVRNEAGATYIVPEDMTVTKVWFKTSTGTATLRLQNGTTDIVAGLAATSSVGSEDTIASADLTAGDVITLDITAINGGQNIAIIMECTQ